jgi:hypothetical protein
MAQIVDEDGKQLVIDGIYLAKIFAGLNKIKNRIEAEGPPSRRNGYQKGLIDGIAYSIEMVEAVTNMSDPQKG